MLREILPIYKREMKSYFTSPALYVAIGLFLAFCGWNFYSTIGIFIQACQQKSTAGMNSFGMPPLNITDFFIPWMFGLPAFLMMFVVPILTMKLFSEEKRLGTFELLVTCPLRDWSILLGKYLAGFSIAMLMIVLSLWYPLTVQLISGWQLESSVLWIAFLGLVLVMATYVAFGVFASSVSENQMLAAILTFVGLLTFYLVGIMNAGGDSTLVQVLKAICILTHGDSFTSGMIRLVDLAYFILFISFFLILTSKILEARRWRV